MNRAIDPGRGEHRGNFASDRLRTYHQFEVILTGPAMLPRPAPPLEPHTTTIAYEFSISLRYAYIWEKHGKRQKNRAQLRSLLQQRAQPSAGARHSLWRGNRTQGTTGGVNTRHHIWFIKLIASDKVCYYNYCVLRSNNVSLQTGKGESPWFESTLRRDSSPKQKNSSHNLRRSQSNVVPPLQLTRSLSNE